MMTWSNVRPGQIWLTYLHFLDHPDIGKVRPVLILDVDRDQATAVALKITSKPPGMRVATFR